MSNFTNIQIGDQVEISLSSNPKIRSTGKIYQIFGIINNETMVLLENGKRGHVVRVINSGDTIKYRIMHEGQNSENKLTFGEDIMRNEVIPKTVQSFLNTDGGYLYIGVADEGTLEDRLVGLNLDFDHIKKGDENMTNDKLCDMLQLRILESLHANLKSDMDIGPLLEFNFVTICKIQILEISIKPSPSPWFFLQTNKKGKPKKFHIYYNGNLENEQNLDYFYIRQGNRKVLLETHKEFYDFVRASRWKHALGSESSKGRV